MGSFLGHFWVYKTETVKFRGDHFYASGTSVARPFASFSVVLFGYISPSLLSAYAGGCIRERGTRTEYEIPGRMEDGGWKRPMVSFFFFLLAGDVQWSSSRPRPTRDPPTDGKVSRGGCRPPGPPGPAPPRNDAYG